MNEIQSQNDHTLIYAILLFLTIFLAFPALLPGVLFLVVIRLTKIDWKIITVVGALVFLVLALTDQAARYTEQIALWAKWAVDMVWGKENPLPNYFDWLWVNIGGGYIFAMAVTLYLEFRNPIKKQVENDLSQLAGFSAKQNISKRQFRQIEKSSHPADGVLLGIDFKTSKGITLTDSQLNGHILLLGATGAGKTTTILNIVQSAAQRNLPSVIIDAKGSPATLKKIEALAVKYGRPIRVFSTREGEGQAWNPLAVGEATELRDKLIALFDFTEPYYHNLAKEYLLNILKAWEAIGYRPDLTEFVECLNTQVFKQRIRNSQMDIDLDSFLGEATEPRELQGITKPLRDLIQSMPRKLQGGFSLYESIVRGEIIVFSLEILRYPELVPRLGRLLTLDLRTAAVRLLGERKKTYVVLDEFGAFANDQIVNVINQTREAGFCNIISTQSLSDFDRISPTLKKLILANCNSYIIQRQNESEDAEDCSKTFGTEMKPTITHQTSIYTGATGTGTVSMQRDFKVSPDEIKELKTGEAFIMSKLPPEFLAKVMIREVS